jgi:hypothetical protein
MFFKVKKAKPSQCLIKYHAMKTTGSEGVTPYILDLGNRWRLAIGFTPLSLYHRGNIHKYKLDRRLDGPQCSQIEQDLSVVQSVEQTVLRSS